MTQLDFAVFDADNHLYETEDALTRHLPARTPTSSGSSRSRGARSSWCATRSPSSSRTRRSRWWRRPASHMAFYAGENAEGKTLRELTGKPMACVPAFREPEGPPRAARRAGHRRLAHVPDAGQPDRGAAARRPGAHPGRDPRLQRVAPRRVDLRLRGSDVRHADRQPVPRSTRASPSSSSCSTGAPRRSCCARHR